MLGWGAGSWVTGGTLNTLWALALSCVFIQGCGTASALLDQGLVRFCCIRWSPDRPGGGTMPVVAGDRGLRPGGLEGTSEVLCQEQREGHTGRGPSS